MADFCSEMKMLSQLRSPNIVCFIGGCIDLPNIAIVTEFCAMGAVEDVLLDPTFALDARTAFRMIVEICQGMLYLNSKGVVHRDLKPANILLSRAGTAKVADFGLSKMHESSPYSSSSSSSSSTSSSSVAAAAAAADDDFARSSGEEEGGGWGGGEEKNAVVGKGRLQHESPSASSPPPRLERALSSHRFASAKGTPWYVEESLY